jgi:hypothetical protein
MEALIFSILQIQTWPMDAHFYECLNLLANKLNDFEDLSEIKISFHERLTRFVFGSKCWFKHLSRLLSYLSRFCYRDNPILHYFYSHNNSICEERLKAQ